MIAAMDPRFPTGKFVFNPTPTAENRRDRIAAIGGFPQRAEARAGRRHSSTDRTARAAGPPARWCTTSPTVI